MSEFFSNQLFQPDDIKVDVVQLDRVPTGAKPFVCQDPEGGSVKGFVIDGHIHIQEVNVPTQECWRSPKDLKDGQPCSPGCAHHVTRPCEKCGRTMARGEVLQRRGERSV